MTQLKAKARQNEPDKFERIAWVLLIGTGVLVGYAYNSSQSAHHAELASVSPKKNPQISPDRVEFHRNEIGVKLNEERIGVQYDNVRLAPSLAKSKPTEPYSPDITNGVPLTQEPYHRQDEIEKLQSVSSRYADIDVQNKLGQAEQTGDGTEAERSKFVHEFVRNAASEGVEVSVHSNLDVDIVREPQSIEGPSSSIPKSSK